MLSQNTKKIYIINFNPKDFFDLTLEALENLQTSDLIISTRELDKKFRLNLNKINSALEINTGLLKNRTKCIKYLISKLNKFNSISYLCFGDFNTSETFFDENLKNKSPRVAKVVNAKMNPLGSMNNKKKKIAIKKNKLLRSF